MRECARARACVCVCVCVCVRAQELYPIHCALLESFERCLEPGGDISKGFLDASQGLLLYGIYAAKLPKAVERVCMCVRMCKCTYLHCVPVHFLQAKQLQNRRETGQVLQACQDRSGQRFPLKDLLNVPIQRFLKYPLLIKVPVYLCVSNSNQSSLQMTISGVENT